MATLRQKTAFGPGVYRGYNLHAEKLRKFAEGTNKAIAAGVPIPLLKRHAPINADDSTTLGAAQLEGAGWVTKVHIEADGSLAFEAKDVPADVAEAVNNKTARFTSPEFRENYACEKAGVYEGPIIRHFAFTPIPGNPHQGEIQTMALSEAEYVQRGLGMPVRPILQHARPMCTIAPELGCFQFTEDDREDGSYKASGDYPKATEDAADNPDHKTPKDLGSGMEGESIESETLLDDEEWGTDETGKKVKRKKAKTTEGDKPATNDTGDANNEQYGERDEDGFNKPANDEPPAPDAIADTEAPPESPPVNPDMPPVATDKSKLTAVLAGLAQKGVILPSDYDFVNPGALDIILAALNSSLKAEQDAEAEEAQEVETEDPPVQDASMPFSEANRRFKKLDVKAIFKSLRSGEVLQFADSDDHPQLKKVLEHHGYEHDPDAAGSWAGGMEAGEHAHIGPSHGEHGGHSVFTHPSGRWTHTRMNDDSTVDNHEGHGARQLHHYLRGLHGKPKGSSQHTELQFSEAELAAMPAKARAVIEAGQKALLAERKAKEDAERKALQFAERERVTRNNSAREQARTAISKAKIPPAVRMRLLEDLGDSGAVQFTEGTEKATYTATQVAAMLEGVIPPHLQFNEQDVTETEAPKVRVQIGVDGQNNPVYSNYSSQQYFEQGDGMPSNHVDPARAEELVAGNSAIPQFNRSFSVASHVARENVKHPNNVMRN